jgi:predicted dehydrogenase
MKGSRIKWVMGMGVAIGLASCTNVRKDSSVTFMVADPGHFHASLVLKSMYSDVRPDVYVYAPAGPELDDFRNRVEAYQTRADQPTHWDFHVYAGPDFFPKMMEEKPGNVLILAGNNQKKTDYILKAIRNGINVFADKPMAINPDDFNQLESAFRIAGQKGLLLYDIMTERFEITSILQKELSHSPPVFGNLTNGTPDDPAVTKESVHHFFKYVSGTKLTRPPWFFDVKQEGEGIADVTTHLVDLVQWACFPGQIINYRTDLKILSARHWATDMQYDEFREVTGRPTYPDYLLPVVTADSVLHVMANGEIVYRIKGVNVRISVKWNYKAPEGGGDTHFSVMKGTLSRLEIRQGPEQHFQPELYVVPAKDSPGFEDNLAKEVKRLAGLYPGISVEKADTGYHILIPAALRVGHEAHFAQVTKNYLRYLQLGALPDWEVPNMLAKYWLTTTAMKMANQ